MLIRKKIEKTKDDRRNKDLEEKLIHRFIRFRKHNSVRSIINLGKLCRFEATEFESCGQILAYPGFWFPLCKELRPVIEWRHYDCRRTNI
jgi:hypothetical protein